MVPSSGGRFRSAALAPLLAAFLSLGPPGAGAAQSLEAAPTAGAPLFTRSDLRFGAAAVAAIAASTLLDRQIGEEAPEENSGFARHASRAAEHLGSPIYVGSALLAGYAAGRVFGDPALERSVFRIGAGVVAAGAAAGAIKLAVGRSRPYETPGDADVVRPFSGHTSFPSGHTTIAFALAAGIDRVTAARWVPWVVYPAAGIVGWSRLRDDQHWTSDVVAGALLGTWTAGKAIRWVERRARTR
jgi:membrane-associated phospholipid phosphatase